MEALGRKLDRDVYAKLTGNRITNDVLWQLDDNDLLEMGIVEKGPRKTILNYIAKHGNNEHNESSSSSLEEQDVTIRSILEKDPKFETVLRQFLDYDLVPDGNALLCMNRILVKHFFEHRILHEKRYPSWIEKQRLAEKILIEFPQLESLRTSEDAPAESYFFWRRGGRSRGEHTGIIETRIGNMRKDVPPGERLFRRKKIAKIVVPDGIEDYAGRLAALTPAPLNARNISEGMEHCFPLHQWILNTRKDGKTAEILRTFPHLLSYRGILIQQVYERLMTNYDDSADLSKFLTTGIMLDNKSWNNVQDKHIKGILRIFKNLTNRGIKRKAESNEMQLEEMIASPLIRWVKIEDKTDIDAINNHAKRSDLLPHIVCLADLFSHGPYYIVFEGHVIPCGNSSTQAVDVFFKMFEVLGVIIPVLLRKLHELIALRVYKTVQTSSSQTVITLSKRFEEIGE